MPVIAHGLNPEHAALWKTQTWMGGRADPAWRAEERRIAALPVNELLAMDPSGLDDWQRCLVAERLVLRRRTAEALRVLATVGTGGAWHSAVSYPDVFQALSEAWREAGAPERRVEVLERALAHARARDPANARMCGLDLAEALCAAGQVDRALGIFAEQIRTQPLDPWPYWFMGTSLVEAGRPAWAAAALRRGLQVLRSVRDPEGLAGQFEDLLREAAAGGKDAPTLPGDFERLFATPLPRTAAAARPTQRPGRPTPPRAGAARGKVPKVGRNDPCPCGSGKKYKRCCGA